MSETNLRSRLSGSGPGRQPMYAALADVLTQEIREGKYKPSSAIPTEKELSELYGVSRQTVRQALRHVKDRGLISSHAGIGTIVRDLADQKTFSSVNSIEQLLEFVGTTEMHAVSLQQVKVGEPAAKMFECPVGTLLSEVGFIRKTPGSDQPMSYVLIYVQPKFAAAQITPKISSAPIYKNIEALFGVRVHEVRQDISATVLDQSLARILEGKVGDPALAIKRFYYDANGGLVQMSISYYPADRYTQSTRFRAIKESR